MPLDSDQLIWFGAWALVFCKVLQVIIPSLTTLCSFSVQGIQGEG